MDLFGVSLGEKCDSNGQSTSSVTSAGARFLAATSLASSCNDKKSPPQKKRSGLGGFRAVSYCMAVVKALVLQTLQILKIGPAWATEKEKNGNQANWMAIMSSKVSIILTGYIPR